MGSVVLCSPFHQDSVTRYHYRMVPLHLQIKIILDENTNNAFIITRVPKHVLFEVKRKRITHREAS
jgi:hypothetical protein